MNNKRYKFFPIFILLFLCLLVFSDGNKAMANTAAVLYRVTLENNKNRAIVVHQTGKKITLVFEGFGQTIELEANNGGTSTCRTVIEHSSDKGSVMLSLPVPDPRAPCRMLPGFVSVESQTYKLSLNEEKVKKVTGSNAKLRSAVDRILGKNQSEE